MFYDHLEDLRMIFYFARIILAWVFIHKFVLWIFRKDIWSFNILFGAMYIVFHYYDMKTLRIITVMLLSIINSLQLLSK
jgi:hypothetical protein